MKTKLKRALSAVLTCAMVLGVMPAIAGAAGNDAEVIIDLSNKEDTTVLPGAKVTFTSNVDSSVVDAAESSHSGTYTTGSTLDSDVTYTLKITLDGYGTYEDEAFKPVSGTNPLSLSLGKNYDITYYNAEEKVISSLDSSKFPSTYTFGTGITATDFPGEPYEDDYEFEGWYDAATGGTKVTEISTSSSGEVKLYAIYSTTITPKVKKAVMTVDADTKSEVVTLDSTITATDASKQPVPTYGDISLTFNTEMSKAGKIVLTPTVNSSNATRELDVSSIASDKKIVNFEIESSKALVANEIYKVTLSDFTTSDGTSVSTNEIYYVTATTVKLQLKKAYLDSKYQPELEFPYGYYADPSSDDFEPDTSTGITFIAWYLEATYKTKAKAATLLEDTTWYAYFSDNGGNNTSTTDSSSSTTGKVYPRLDKTKTAYISGYSDGSFKPNAYMTREEVASMFYNMVNSSTLSTYGTSENDFTDVASDRWSNTAISTLSKAGVLTGYSDGTFRPSATITRAEFVTILTRLQSASSTSQSTFTDIETHWAKSAIVSATGWGVVNGYSDNTFRPDQNVTRAEAVAMVNRLMDKNVSSDSLSSSMKTFTDNQDTSAWYYLDIQIAAN